MDSLDIKPFKDESTPVFVKCEPYSDDEVNNGVKIDPLAAPLQPKNERCDALTADILNREEWLQIQKEEKLDDSIVFAQNIKKECDNTVEKKKFPSRGKYIKTGKRHMCHLCGKKYSAISSLNRHIESHFKQPEKKVMCNVCGLKCFSNSALDRHLWKHSKKKTFQCVFCDKLFKHKHNLASHTKIVHIQGIIFRCSLCELKYCRKDLLKRHIEEIHIKLKPFKCNTCGMMFARNDRLERHVQTHEKIKKFACELCLKRFKTSDGMRQHVDFSHKKTLGISCESCAKRFRSRYELENHKMIHTGEMPYVCYLCGKKAYFKNVIASHMKVHARKRAFICYLCECMFSLKRSLRNHILKKHVIGNNIRNSKLSREEGSSGHLTNKLNRSVYSLRKRKLSNENVNNPYAKSFITFMRK